MTESIDYGSYSFLKILLLPIDQKGNQFYVGKVLAKDLLYMFTVRPTEYDIAKNKSLAKTFVDDSEYYSYLIKNDEQKLAEKDFQRDYDPTRVSKITQFLKEEEFPFFPNTIIVTCDLINNIEELDVNVDNSFEDFAKISNRPQQLAFLQLKDNQYYLYVPYRPDTILVIDGQHRMRGLKDATESIKDNYELLLSFMIDLDRSVIAKLFYTINYEQKSVNKSLLYHLTGEFSTELDQVTFMHNVVKVLNELDYSPFFNKIKMLGVNPKNTPDADKLHLTISQAFLIDYLIKTISKSSSNSIFAPIFLWYYNNEEYQIEIIRFLIKYFDAVKKIRIVDWKNPTTNILTKGIGIAALIKVLHILFVKLFVTDWKTDPTQIKFITSVDLELKLKGLENVDFSKEGEFGGVGSGGSINKLYQKIIENVQYFGSKNYSTFLETFKTTYLEPFQAWLKPKTR